MIKGTVYSLFNLREIWNKNVIQKIPEDLLNNPIIYLFIFFTGANGKLSKCFHQKLNIFYTWGFKKTRFC